MLFAYHTFKAATGHSKLIVRTNNQNSIRYIKQRQTGMMSVPQQKQRYLKIYIKDDTTPHHPITIELLPNAAPETVKHAINLVQAGLFNNGNCSFYRSDFVIQFGLHGSNVKNPYQDLKVNETPMYEKISNTRGTISVAHFDVPDNGNSEYFINLGENKHLDSVYGGYCVFGKINPNDTQSFHTVDYIATKIKQGGSTTKVPIERIDFV